MTPNLTYPEINHETYFRIMHCGAKSCRESKSAFIFVPNLYSSWTNLENRFNDSEPCIYVCIYTCVCIYIYHLLTIPYWLILVGHTPWIINVHALHVCMHFAFIVFAYQDGYIDWLAFSNAWRSRWTCSSSLALPGGTWFWSRAVHWQMNESPAIAICWCWS